MAAAAAKSNCTGCKVKQTPTAAAAGGGGQLEEDKLGKWEGEDWGKDWRKESVRKVPSTWQKVHRSLSSRLSHFPSLSSKPKISTPSCFGVSANLLLVVKVEDKEQNTPKNY